MTERLNRLEVENFGGLKMPVAIELTEGPVTLSGPHSAGKTSCANAIRAMTCGGYGRLPEHIRTAIVSEGAVAGIVVGETENYKIEFVRDQNGDEKLIVYVKRQDGVARLSKTDGKRVLRELFGSGAADPFELFEASPKEQARLLLESAGLTAPVEAISKILNRPVEVASKDEGFLDIIDRYVDKSRGFLYSERTAAGRNAKHYEAVAERAERWLASVDGPPQGQPPSTEGLLSHRKLLQCCTDGHKALTCEKAYLLGKVHDFEDEIALREQQLSEMREQLSEARLELKHVIDQLIATPDRSSEIATVDRQLKDLTDTIQTWQCRKNAVDELEKAKLEQGQAQQLYDLYTTQIEQIRALVSHGLTTAGLDRFGFSLNEDNILLLNGHPLDSRTAGRSEALTACIDWELFRMRSQKCKLILIDEAQCMTPSKREEVARRIAEKGGQAVFLIAKDEPADGSLVCTLTGVGGSFDGNRL